MKPASYTYQVLEHKGRQVIIIKDEKEFSDSYRRSAIMDIDIIIDHIEEAEQLHAEKCIVLVRGTCLTWDAYDAGSSEFAGLAKLDWTSAFQNYVFQLAIKEKTPAAGTRSLAI